MATPIQIAEANGIVIPDIAWNASRDVGVPFWATCAFLMQESSGGHNVFGHDQGAPFEGAGEVTKEKYLAYKTERERTGRAQGVGPMQLTFHAFQDAADDLGGCWQPKYNVIEGLRILKGFIEGGKTWHQAAAAYNGSEAYADQMDDRFDHWRQLLANADVEDGQPAHQPGHGESDAYERVTWRGHSFDKMTVAAILAAEQRLGFQVIITQGSYNTSVKASGNTHAGGGALDMHFDPATAPKIVRAFRETGFAAWRRFALAGVWPDHLHALLLGNDRASDEAKKQWSDYRARLDGLPPGAPTLEGPDLGPHLEPIPRFHYSTKPEWPGLHTSGPAVRTMQKKLAAAGYYHGGDEPGYYGNHTRASIKVFQLAQHWTGADANGLLGPVTWARIQALPDAPPPEHEHDRDREDPKPRPEPDWPQLHTSSPAVRLMQRKLTIAGFYHGGDEPAFYGAHTRAAVRSFQEAQHWSGGDADGLLGTETWRRIQNLPDEAPPAPPPEHRPPAEHRPPHGTTTPPATEPPATEPPATEPPATEPPATEPPATEPPATEPPATEPPATEPPATEPPATEPPATTNPPSTEPPETEVPTQQYPPEKSASESAV